MKKIPTIIKNASRRLRQTMTCSEKILWSKLKSRKFYNVKFLRQLPIYVYTENSWLDRYVIPDFICREYKVIIELDWNIHEEKEIYKLDRYKEFILNNLWYKILRFKNDDIINNINFSLIKIKKILITKKLILFKYNIKD